MGRQKKRKSRNELKPGFSRHKSALDDHVDKHGSRSKSAPRLKRWTLEDTTQLKRAIARDHHASLKPLSFDFIKRCHERILLRREPHAHVIEALDMLYGQVRGKTFDTIIRQIRGPHHDHVLIPLSKRILNTSSKERRGGLWALRRLNHPAACDVAEHMFERYGRGTQIMCVQLIGDCGTMRHIGSLKRLLEQRRRLHKDVIHELERTIERLERKFPEHTRRAGEGALSVSAMGDQSGALSLDGHAGKGQLDVHAQMQQLITTHGSADLITMGDDESMWFDLTLPPRKPSLLARASMAWMPLWHWTSTAAILLLGLLVPHEVFAVTSTAIAVIMLGALFVMSAQSRQMALLEAGRVIDAVVSPRGEGHVAMFRDKEKQQLTREIELPQTSLSREVERARHLVLWSEQLDDVILVAQYRQISVTEDGELKPRHPWRLLGFSLLLVAALLRVGFLILM